MALANCEKTVSIRDTYLLRQIVAATPGDPPPCNTAQRLGCADARWKILQEPGDYNTSDYAHICSTQH